MPTQSHSSKSAAAISTVASGSRSALDVAASSSSSSPSTSRTAKQQPLSASTCPVASSSSSIGLTHHPFRIEVQEVSPVSISLRWSLRPPPISQLRKHLPLRRGKQSSNGEAHGIDAEQDEADDDDGEGDGDEEDDDDATAVDGSASERDEDLPEARSAPQMTNPSTSPTRNAASALSKIFDSGVSVTVNGACWSQVVMADQGSDESIIVIYGLEPNRAYDVEMSVGGPDSKQRAIILSTSAATASVPEEGNGSSSQPSPLEGAGSAIHSSEQGHSSGAVTPTGTLNTAADRNASTSSSPSVGNDAAQQALVAATNLRTSLTTELRQARRDASRAEQALRNEIEAIKRSLDRMSSVDHRSKQKVLALQESIRQANQSAKDVGLEADEVDKGQATWEEEASELGKEEDERRREVEGLEAQNDSQVKQEEDKTAVAEKELAGVAKALAGKQGEVDKLQTGKLAELEREIARLQAESNRINNSATPPLPAAHAAPIGPWPRGPSGGFDSHAAPFHPSPGNGAGMAAPGGYRSVSAGGGRGGRGQGGRGAKGGRNASGPHPFHRRGRGGGSAAGSAANYQQQQLAAGVYGVDPSAAGYGAGASGFLDHNAYLSSGFTTGAASGTGTGGAPSPSGLNPASSDFIPSSSSTHASPTMSKNATGGAGPWASGGPFGPSASADFSPAMNSRTMGGSSARGGSGGLSSGPNSVTHGSNESPTAAHPHFGVGGYGPRLESPSSVVPPGGGIAGPTGGLANTNSPFAAPLGPLNPSLVGGYHLHQQPYHHIPSRRPSGPLDFDDDAAFDPTQPASAISPQFSAAGVAPGSSRFLPSSTSSSSSPWARGPADDLLQPSNSSSSTGTGVSSSPWAKASSPLLGSGISPLPSSSASMAGGSTAAPISAGGDDIWSMNVSPTASALRPQQPGGIHQFYQQRHAPSPTSIFGSGVGASPFSHAARTASGSSGSIGHTGGAGATAGAIGSGGGGGSTPTSPTSGGGSGHAQRGSSGSGSGGFGAIGGGAGGGGGED